MVRSFLGHLDLQIKQDAGRPPTPHQVTTFHWLLEEAKVGGPFQRVESLRPMGDGEVITVTDLQERLASLAEILEG